MKKLLSLLCTFSLLSASAVYADGVTRLLCQGSGTVSDNQTTVGTQFKSDSDKTKTTVSNTMGHRSFNGAATVEISGNAVRFQLPHEMVPGLNNAHDGWFTMDQSFVGDKEITGVLALNFLNKPKVKIDRMSGLLTVASGFSDFSGPCTKVDADAAPKF